MIGYLKLDLDHDFLWAHTMEHDLLIHTLELKLQHFEIFPICLHREAMHLQCFPPTRYARRCHVHTRT